MPTWDAPGDFDAEQDESGVVHNATAGNTDAGAVRVGYTFEAPPFTNGLVGWWPLLESAGDAVDYSGRGNTGAVSGATQAGGYAPAGVTAYYFDGVDDTIDISSLSPPNGAFSVFAWVWLNTTGGTQVFVDPTGNALYLDNGNLRVYTTSLLLDAGWSPNATQWYHVGYTADANGATLYIDAAQRDTYPSSVSFDGRSASAIGSRRDNQSYTDGHLSDVRLYDRALSAAEVQTLYEWGTGDYTQPPADADGGILWYDFTDSSATDRWGSNDGTITGATWVSDGGPRGDGAFSFDGTDDDISIPVTSLDGVSELTLAVWVSTPFDFGTFQNNPGVLMKRDNWSNLMGMWFSKDDGLYCRVETSGDIVSALIPLSKFREDQYYHVAMTFDSGTVRAYRNGQFEAEATNGSTTTTPTLSSPWRLANLNEDPDYLPGEFAEVRMYDRALHDREIHEIYRYGTLGRDLRQLAVEAR